MSIKLPPGLYNDNNWRGILLCAVIVNHRNLNGVSPNLGSAYARKIICRLDNDGGILDSPIVFSIPKKCHRPGPFQLLVYVSHEEFRAQLGERSCVSPSVTSNSSDIETKQCGARLIYGEDGEVFGRQFYQLCRDLESKHHETNPRSQLVPTVGWSNGQSCSYARAKKAGRSCWNTRARREFKSLLSQLYQVDYAQNHWYDYVFPQTAIPRWFPFRYYSTKMSLDLDPNYGSMIGLAVCGYRTGSSQGLKICLSFFGLSVTHRMTIPLSRDIFVGSSRLVVGYIPLLVFRLNPCSEIQVSFYSGNDTIGVIMCGARVVYEQDIGEFVNILVDLICAGPVAYQEFHHQSLLNQVAKLHKCNQGEHFICPFSPKRRTGSNIENVAEDWTSPETFPKQAIVKCVSTNSSASIHLGVEFGNGRHGSTTPTSVLESRFKTYLEDIYQTGIVFSHCFPQDKVPSWFCCRVGGPLAELVIPPYLMFSPDWRGFAFCVLCSFDKHPTAVRNNLNKKVSHSFTCFVETDFGLREIVSHSISEDEVLISLYRRSFTWVLFIPPGKHLLRWSRKTRVKFLFVSEGVDINMMKCRARLVDERSMKDFSHTMVQLITSYVAYSNEVRTSCDRGSAIYDKLPIFLDQSSGADSSKEDLHSQDFDPSCAYSHCFRPSKATQKWFSHRNSGHSVTIGIPTNLCIDNNWLGLTLYACFSEEGDQLPIFERIVSKNEHRLSCQVQTRGNIKFGSYYEVSRSELLQRGQFLWILYLTGDRVREMMDGCSHIKASFSSDCTGVVVQNCGVRLLYQSNQLEFQQKLSHYNAVNIELQEDHHQFLAYKKKIMEQNLDHAIHMGPTLMKEDTEYLFLGKDIRLEIKQCRKDLMDFDGCSVLNFCLPPREIFSWFSHCSNGSSETIDVPTHWYDDRDWMGLFLFAYFSVPGCESGILETPNLAASLQLICCLESSVAGLEPICHVHVTNKQESRWIRTEDEFLWLSYIPSGLLPEWLSQGTALRASFASDEPSLIVKRSGLRFFHLRDQEELELILYRCFWAILTPYCMHQFMAEVDDKTELERSSSFDQCQQNDMSIRPFHQSESNRTKNQHNRTKLLEFDQYGTIFFYFPPSKILEWFKHQSDKPFVTILLPPNLHKDRTCMGLAICVSFSILEPSTIIDNHLDLEFCCSLRCQFESTEELFEDLFPCPLTETTLKLFQGSGFSLLTYMPCGWFSNWGYQSSYIEVSIETNTPCITMQTCGYRLLYHSDEIVWKKIMRHCKASFSKNRDVAHQVGEITKSTHEDKAKAYMTSIYDEDSPSQRRSGSLNPKLKHKGKCVIK